MHTTEHRSAHLILIDVGVQQLLVAAVDDCGPVAGSKDMLDAIALKGLGGDGLAAQTQLLPVTQLPCKPQLSQAQWVHYLQVVDSVRKAPSCCCCTLH